MKKLFAYLLIFCMVFSMLPTAAAETAEIASGTCGENLTWVLTEDGQLTISGTGDMSGNASVTDGAAWYVYKDQILSVEIQEGVTSIGHYAFSECSALTSVTIPASVVSIGQGAFYKCLALTQLELPSGLTEIPRNALFMCESLTELEIPASVESIGIGAFWGCSSLTQLELPEGLKEIGSSAFGNCDSLTHMTILEGITEIPWQLFVDCYRLESVTFPSTVTSIDQGTFLSCPALKEFVIPEGVAYIPTQMFMNCYTLSSVTIPDSVTQIGAEAFKDTGKLTSLTLPDALTTIGDQAFVDSGIQELVIPAGVSAIGSKAFYSSALETFKFRGSAPASIGTTPMLYLTATAYYPGNDASWTEEVRSSFGGTITWVAYEAGGSLPCDDGHHVPATNAGQETGVCAYCGIPCCTSGTAVWAIEEDGTMIIYGTGENGAGELYSYSTGWTKYADQVTALVIEAGVTGRIYSFTMFENLVSVSLPEGITEIENDTFGGCINLEQVNFPESLTRIGSNSFHSCVKLTEVHLPAALAEFGGRPFGGCTNLEGIWVDAENPYYANDQYGALFSKDMTQLIEVPGKYSGVYVIPETVNYIEWAAFDGCQLLTGVEIPDGITELQMNLFENCTSLKSITIPASVNSLWINVFMGCTGLESVTFAGNAPDFMGDCFQSVTATAYYPADNETWTEEVMQDYGGTITWVACTDPETEYLVDWDSASTSLKGTIDLNIYVILSENLVNDAETFMRFSYASKVVDVSMADANRIVEDGVVLYRFSCKMSAREVADTVTVQMMNGSGSVGTPLEYSIMQYCVNRIKKSSNPAQVALCKALLNYATAAQVYFNYHTENLANASLSEADKTLATPDVSSFAAVKTGSQAGITLTGATMMLQSEVKVRIYFILEDGYDIGDLTFMVDGKKVTPSSNGGEYYIESEGIPAKQLDEMHEFKLGGLTVSYGPMCFVKNKLSSSKPATVDLVKALYAYYAAAEALLG